MKQRCFPAKVLLFGEYAIILGGAGLAVPFNAYSGRFYYAAPTVRIAPHIVQSQEALLAFAEYWATKEVPFAFEAAQLASEVRGGLFFHSDIPQGYGLGSSGALVAALYDRYAPHNLPADSYTPQDLSTLKSQLAMLESYFHGQSSGIDPLISYLNCPLSLHPNNEVRPIPLPLHYPDPTLATQPALFLYDTEMPRKTGHLVAWFMAECTQNSRFQQLCQHRLTDLNAACVEAFLSQNYIELCKKWRDLSVFQYENLRPLIPQNLLQQWLYGLKTDAYYLKLCGAGGGGFMLGLSTDWRTAEVQLAAEKVKMLI